MCMNFVSPFSPEETLELKLKILPRMESGLNLLAVPFNAIKNVRSNEACSIRGITGPCKAVRPAFRG